MIKRLLFFIFLVGQMSVHGAENKWYAILGPNFGSTCSYRSEESGKVAPLGSIVAPFIEIAYQKQFTQYYLGMCFDRFKSKLTSGNIGVKILSNQFDLKSYSTRLYANIGGWGVTGILYSDPILPYRTRGIVLGVGLQVALNKSTWIMPSTIDFLFDGHIDCRNLDCSFLLFKVGFAYPLKYPSY